MTATRLNRKITHGTSTKSVAMTNSWHGHYYGEATITFADQGTTSYTLLVTAEDGGAIVTTTVKSKTSSSATLFVMLPYSGTRDVTFNYAVYL